MFTCYLCTGRCGSVPLPSSSRRWVKGEFVSHWRLFVFAGTCGNTCNRWPRTPWSWRSTLPRIKKLPPTCSKVRRIKCTFLEPLDDLVLVQGRSLRGGKGGNCPPWDFQFLWFFKLIIPKSNTEIATWYLLRRHCPPAYLGQATALWWYRVPEPPPSLLHYSVDSLHLYIMLFYALPMVFISASMMPNPLFSCSVALETWKYSGYQD